MTRQLTSKEVREIVERRLGFVTRGNAKWMVLAKDFNDAYAQEEVAARIESRTSAKECEYQCISAMNHGGRVSVHCATCQTEGAGNTLDEAMTAATCAR